MPVLDILDNENRQEKENYQKSNAPAIRRKHLLVFGTKQFANNNTPDFNWQFISCVLNMETLALAVCERLNAHCTIIHGVSWTLIFGGAKQRRSKNFDSGC